MNVTDATRQTRVAKARAILNTSGFRNSSGEEKRRVVRVMVERGLLLEDLQMLQAELFPKKTQTATQPLTSGAGQNLLALDKLVISKILLNMKPQDVLSTCRVDKKYARVCNDSQIFQLLMEAHYPDSILTNDPHRQYVALTSGVETTYFIEYQSAMNLEQTNPEQIGEPGRPEDDPTWSSRNLGTIWILNFLNDTPFALVLDPLDLQEIREMEAKVSEYERMFSRKPQITADGEQVGEALFSLMNQLFKSFMKKYRSMGFEEAVAQTSPLSFTKEALQEFKGRIMDFLHEGRLYYGLGRNVRNDRFFLDLPGLPVPRGTKLWGLLHLKYPQRTLQVFKNKERLLRYVTEDLYSDVVNIILGQFAGFLANVDLARVGIFLNSTTEKRLQMPEFQGWFAQRYPTFGSLSKQGLRNYLSVPDFPYRGGLVSRIGDYYLIEVQF